MSAAVDGSLLSLRRISANLAVYGLAHALVDAISAGMLFTLWHLKVLSVTETGFCFLFYNLLAFGTQPVLGLVMDRMQRSRGGAMAGCLLMVLATIGFTQRPLLSIVLVGLGNALFHLGAGSICLNLTAGRAAASGIFVAPGAAGLFLERPAPGVGYADAQGGRPAISANTRRFWRNAAARQPVRYRDAIG